MKTLITLFLFLSLFSQSQPSQKSNFLITIKTCKTTAVFKNVGTATADSLLRTSTGINSGISGFMENSPFFEIRTQTILFYCELKKSKPSKKSIPGTTPIFNDAQAKIQPNE